MQTSKKYDVVILGSGIGGSMLACILAKNGVSTLLIEELSHPRFTIGESLIPETGLRLRILAEKYGVPEIGWIGAFHALRDNVTTNCGVKRSFSFMYHRPGQISRPDETNQLPTLTPPFGPDSHLFRQDTDSYLATRAVKYGADFRQQVKVARIELGSPDNKDDEIRIHTANNEVIRGSFLVDGGGMRSHIATQLKLRDATPRFRTDTRTLYTHFVGLKPADLLFKGREHKMPSAFGQATMHHVFDGGWMWLIPFNNHRDSTNPLVSVGMMLDRRKHPDSTEPAEQEFRKIISRYPTIAQHFSEAKAVRPWVSSGRLQYSQKHVLGPRVLQLPHAASFVDPLFSSGMSVLTVAMDLIAEQLLAAVKENNFAQERFQVMEDVVNQGFDHYDMIVSHSFDAFENYELWNAWNRMWMMGNYMGTWGPLSLLLKYLSSDDRSYLALTTARERVGVLSSHLPEIRDMMVISAKDVEEAVGGRMPHSEAAKRIFARMEAMDFLPPYMGFGKAEQRAPAVFSQPAGFRHVLWYRYSAPPKWKEYADFPIMAYTEHVFRFFFDQGKTAARRFLHAFRDVFIDYNNDWRYTPMGQRAEGYVVLPPPMPEDVPELGEVKSLPSQKGSMAASMTEGDAQRIAEPSSRAG